MKKLTLMLIMLLLFVLNLNFSNANIEWKQNANSNYQSYGGNSFIMYGSNTLNPEENLTYEKCSFLYGSDYQPVISDFTRDGLKEIILTDEDNDIIYIYNTACELLNTYDVGEGINAMPTISTEFDILKSANILTDETFRRYGYFSSDTGFIELYDYLNYSHYSWWSGNGLNFFTCNDDSCLLFRKGDDNIYHIDLFDEFFTNTSNELSKPIFSGSYDDIGRSGISSIEGLNGNDWVIVCNIGTFEEYLNGGVYCDLVDMNDGLVKKSFHSTGGGSAKFSNYYYLDTGGAVQGAEKRVYISYHNYNRVGADMKYHRKGVLVFDLIGNKLFEDAGQTSTGTSPAYAGGVTEDFSNIAVADFDKDGSNDMCYFECDSTFVKFSCYDGDYNQIFLKSNMSSDFSYTGNSGLTYDTLCPQFVLGDFMTEYSRLCMATVEGIFCFNDTNNNTIQIYDSSYTSGDGVPLVVEITTDGYLGVIYTDSSKGFIMTPDFINYSTCGNGICEAWENSFTCSEDCYYIAPDVDAEGEYREGSHCESDADCKGGLKCEYGICTLLTFGYECTSDSDCLSGECLNGYCTKASFFDKISASKGQQFGDDTNSNNFISLFFIIGISGFLMYYGNIIAGVFALYILSIFFVIVNWLSPFILIGMIITGLIALVFKNVVKSE